MELIATGDRNTVEYIFNIEEMAAKYTEAQLVITLKSNAKSSIFSFNKDKTHIFSRQGGWSSINVVEVNIEDKKPLKIKIMHNFKWFQKGKFADLHMILTPIESSSNEILPYRTT